MKSILTFITTLVLLCSFVAAPQGTHAPNNPYCDKTFTDFQPPAFMCPPRNAISVTCIDDCRNTYQIMMAGLYSSACLDYDAAHAGYVATVNTSLDTFRACDAAASTPEEKILCMQAATAAAVAAQSQLQVTQASIASTLAASAKGEADVFLACALLCCHPVQQH